MDQLRERLKLAIVYFDTRGQNERSASVKMQHEPATEGDRLRSRISAAFLQDFQKGLSIVRGLNVTIDTDERGDEALIQSFNSSITTDGEQKQFLLQIVAEHRRSLPNSNKSNMVKNFKDLQ